LTSFLTDYGVVVALVCAGAAVVYGLIITQRLLSKSPGNERMQEISAAVQEGALTLTPPSDAVANMRVIDAIYRAAGLDPRPAPMEAA